MKELSTKGDLRELEVRLTGNMRELKLELMAEIKLNRWMLALIIVVNILPILKEIFIR